MNWPKAFMSVEGTWKPIGLAPKDRPILVWAPGRLDLPPICCLCQWHEDAGFCVDELREPTHYLSGFRGPDDGNG